MYGYSDDEARPGVLRDNLDRLDFERGVIAFERESKEDFVRRRRAFRKGRKGSFEFETDEGKHYLIRERAMADGGTVVVRADITERKRSERTQQYLLDSVPAPILVTSADTHEILFANPFAIEAYSFGATPVGKSVLNGYEEPQRRLDLVERLRRGGVVEQFETRLRNAEGEPQWELVSAQMIRYQDRDAVLAVSQNIDEIKRLEEELARQKAIAAPAMAANRNKLVIDIDAGVGTMRSDRTKIGKCLSNLLSNTAKFSEDGRVELAVARDDGGRLAFRVTDTGAGMSPDERAGLFDAFAQADAGTARSYEGAGLGLAITKRFCDMLGGDVAVESEVGKGSTFTITLPATGELPA